MKGLPVKTVDESVLNCLNEGAFIPRLVPSTCGFCGFCDVMFKIFIAAMNILKALSRKPKHIVNSAH